MNKEIQLLIETFFNKFNVAYDTLEINEEEKNIFLIKIKTSESWILIWPHWKNLEIIQWLLKLMITRKLDENVKIHLEINDYMENKDEKLYSFIKSKINLVEKNSKDIQLPFYWAYERKKIHSYVAEYGNKNIFTKSIWEWRERRLYICKKDAKLTIDIDWDDI